MKFYFERRDRSCGSAQDTLNYKMQIKIKLLTANKYFRKKNTGNSIPSYELTLFCECCSISYNASIVGREIFRWTGSGFIADSPLYFLRSPVKG